MTSNRDFGYRDELMILTPGLRRFARALVQDHGVENADDMVQGTLVAALGATPAKCGDSLRTWLLSKLVGLHRSALDQISADRKVSARSGGTPMGVGRSEPSGVAWSGKAGRPALLRSMTLECREALLLVTLEGLSYAQAAETLGVSLNTLIGRLARARQHLATVAPSSAASPPATIGKVRDSAPHLRLVK